MKFKPKMPNGILGGILKHGFNLSAIIHVCVVTFVKYDADRMQVKREARLAREAAANPPTESEREPHVVKETNHDGHHRQSR